MRPKPASDERTKQHLRRSREAIVATLIFCASVSTGGSAEETAPPTASALLQRGITLFSDGSWSASREALRRAASLTRDARTLGQIYLYLGLSYAAEGHVARARAAFSRGLAHDPALEPDTERHKPEIVELFREVQRGAQGVLDVLADAPGPVLWVDGRAVAPLPCSTRVSPGIRVVELKRPSGALLHRSSVAVRAGQVTRLVLQVSPLGRAVAVAPAAQTPTLLAQQSAPRRWTRVWPWVAGAAVAASGVAIALGILARNDAGRACDLLAEPSRSCSSRLALVDPDQRGRYEELFERARGRALAANIAWGGAGVLVAVAAALFWADRR